MSFVCQNNWHNSWIVLQGPRDSVMHLRLFALLVLSLLVSTIDANPLLSQSHVDKELDDPTETRMKHERQYRLFSSCSNKLVQIQGRGKGSNIDALGAEDSIYADLVVETHTFAGRLKIKSKMTGYTLCFNRRGRLIIKSNDDGDRCVFTEILTPDGFSEFQSVANKKWYLGFNKRGKVMKGYKAGSKKRKCAKFTKDVDYTVALRKTDKTFNTWSPNMDGPIAELEKRPRLRHQKSKNAKANTPRSPLLWHLIRPENT
ncbi:fibroblast growth factor 8 isoform X1 [Lingula anatina]|uniref:Fibroblast growth factor 8 isoform X1 n=2 Tax=Lingula anatina TaxID=7574 RepID=A0A1S3HXX5_LINAN|nr:fibroblast growth factor 8 isoform X1 [Lingula anatina]XP_013389925.1 fibroblast growth factor 8 isoform X1 [Lingula anatina]|eukprot:XP_013389924.1 fibroblast growth factor 8 isoform X1 [Lingula anatina]